MPATLDHVLDILPRMPNQLQLHPIKLKRWIQYKSHYMYDMVRRDKIIGALVWLKHHNTHYTCISVNTDWRHPNDICEYDEKMTTEVHSIIGNNISCGDDPNLKQHYPSMCAIPKDTTNASCEHLCSSH